MRYIVVLNVLGIFMTYLARPLYYDYLVLDFDKVMQGQVWRIITFLIPVDNVGNVIFFAIMTYFYYMIGNSLENAWGAFRFNLYFFSGVFFNIIAALILYFITGYSIAGSSLTTVCGTLFFAFAAMYPNMQFLFYFIIPIKAKYLAWFQGAMYIFNIVTIITQKQYFMVVPLLVSLANFFIFFLATRNYRKISPNEIKRKADFRRQMHTTGSQSNVTQFQGKSVVTRHKCAVCGKTEKDDDQLEFRFCSKCDGNYEYCMDHLFTHEHVHRP